MKYPADGWLRGHNNSLGFGLVLEERFWSLNIVSVVIPSK